MNERLQLALIVGCGFVIGLEAPNALRLVSESWTGPYAAPASFVRLERMSERDLLAQDSAPDTAEELVAQARVAAHR
jgi:hypothetical protein